MEAASMSILMTVGSHSLRVQNTRPSIFNFKPHTSKISCLRATETFEQDSSTTALPGRTRRPQNVAGDFYVDNTCIDCDTCRWMAPEVFSRVDGMSVVYKQPSCNEERLKSLQALLACPTNSIRTEKPARDVLEAQKTFPRPVNEERLPGVYYCGYHSKKSYGATSYLITHPQGNILVDSPRYTEKLALNIESLGGVKQMFLTHKDDIADHAKWSKRFGCNRIIHSKDVQSSYTADVETKLEGSGPWTLNDDIELIHTPGHTAGSVCLFYKPLKALFTGDHLVMEESGMSIIDQYNFCSVSLQLKNVEMLLDLDFNIILPGHRRIAEFKDVEDKNSSLKAFLATYGSSAN